MATEFEQWKETTEKHIALMGDAIRMMGEYLKAGQAYVKPEQPSEREVELSKVRNEVFRCAAVIQAYALAGAPSSPFQGEIFSLLAMELRQLETLRCRQCVLEEAQP